MHTASQASWEENSRGQNVESPFVWNGPIPTHIFLGRAGGMEFWLGSHFFPVALACVAPRASQVLLKDMPSLHLCFLICERTICISPCSLVTTRLWPGRITYLPNVKLMAMLLLQTPYYWDYWHESLYPVKWSFFCFVCFCLSRDDFSEEWLWVSCTALCIPRWPRTHKCSVLKCYLIPVFWMHFKILILFWDRVLLCSPSWPWTCNLPALASQVLKF